MINTAMLCNMNPQACRLKQHISPNVKHLQECMIL